MNLKGKTAVVTGGNSGIGAAIVLERASQRVGHLGHNASVETRTSLLDTTEDQYEKVLKINLKSAFLGAQLAAKQMIRQKSGGRITTFVFAMSSFSHLRNLQHISPLI
jgi:NAD(P)-dependent dehydrogenase (short-subunit alcohol dehydrogenase family)